MPDDLLHVILITNLKRNYSEVEPHYIERELAYRYLKHFTEQDFGYDVNAWEKWFKEAKYPIRKLGRLSDITVLPENN